MKDLILTKDWKTKTETHDCFAYCLLPCYKRVRGIQQNHTFYLMDVYVISEGNVKGRIVQILRVSCVLVCFLSICLVLFEFILCNRSSVLHCRLCSYFFSSLISLYNTPATTTTGLRITCGLKLSNRYQRLTLKFLFETFIKKVSKSGLFD